MNIVSLLPSATEIICELGFEDNLVGRSHECDNPPSVKKLSAVSDSSLKNAGNSSKIDHNIKRLLKNGLSIFNVDADLLASLNSDLIITQDHCEVCAVSLDDVKKAVRNHCKDNTKVISLSPTDLSEIFDSFDIIGEALDAKESAAKLKKDLRMRLDIIRKTVIGEPVKRVASIEWLKPLMTGGNWIPELVQIAGGESLLSKAGKHSPWIDWNKIVSEDPDLILLMPCGYTIKQTVQEINLLTQRKDWENLKAVQNKEVYVLDGNHYFNRPGPSIFESARILGEIFHPNLFKPIHHKKGWIRLHDQLISVV